MTQQELELPEGWARTTLDSISYVKNGFAFKSSQYVKSGVPLVRISNIQDNQVDFKKNIVYLTKDNLNSRQDFLISKGDVLMALSGATTGKFGVFSEERSALFNQRVGLIRTVNNECLIQKLLHYFFGSLQNLILRKAFGMAQPNISTNFLKSLDFDLPPLNEQKRIVSKIEELLSNVDSTKQSLEYTKLQLVLYRHSLLKSAFDGKLTEKWREQNNIESLDEILHIIDNDCKNSNYEIENEDQLIIPDDWKTLKIGRAIIFLGSGITPKGGKANYLESGIPFIRSQNVYPYGLHLENIAYVTKELHEEMSRTHTKDGDVLLNITGASIGRSCIIPNKFGDANVNQHVCIIRFHPKINSAFLSYWLNSIKFQTIISSIQQGETRQALNFNQIRGMPFPFCSEQEQEQIVSQIEQGFSLIENSQKIVNSTLQTLETMRMSVLKQAFQGKLVPQDPNDEPAEILLERIKKQKS